jgi:hypothetical protein
LGQEDRAGVLRILVAGVILAAILFLSLERLRPPAPRPASAPATQFSASRARTVLERLVGDGVPHPTGSPENDEVRAHIVAELTALGYQPEIQTAFACSEYGKCATVRNILVRVNGTQPGAAVLLAAHYDSVPAGPGASDDGIGVAATLEIARALKSLQPPRNSIIILIDDGEEVDLLGARAFVGEHLWAAEVRAAVNMDSRGSSGPSLMYETGSANDWVVNLYARNVAHPATSSIFYAVYKMLPNDTDFTIFKAAGYQGLNFANIGGVVHYHTPLDNLENTSSRTLQHTGDNTLPVLLALANSDLENFTTDTTLAAEDIAGTSKHDAVFFDLFERRVVWWRASRSLTLSFIAPLLLLFQIAWLIRNQRTTLSQFLWGVLGWLVALAIAGVAALVLDRALHVSGAIPVNWVAHPLPLLVAFWSLALAVVVTHGNFFAHRAGFWGFWGGVWTWWALLSIVLCWQAPELGYVLLIPSLVAAIAGLPFTLWKAERVPGSGLAAILPLAAAGALGFAPVVLLYDGMGNRTLPFISLLVGLILTPAIPLCADLKNARGLPPVAVLWGPIGIVALSIFAAVVAPAFSAKAPERVNIHFWQDGDSGRSKWIVYPESGHLPEPIRLATTFLREGKGPFPWPTGPAFTADAPHLDLAAPTFTILESTVVEGKRIYRTLLRSERGAPDAMVLFPPNAGVESARVEGEPVVLENDRVRLLRGGWSAFECVTMPARGVEISFALPAGKPVDVYAADRTYALPLEGMFLLKARPLTATPSQEGDVMLVSRRVQLIP